MFSSALWLARTQILLEFSPWRREQDKASRLNPPAAGSRLDARAELKNPRSTLQSSISHVHPSFFFRGTVMCVCACVCVWAKPHVSPYSHISSPSPRGIYRYTDSHRRAQAIDNESISTSTPLLRAFKLRVDAQAELHTPKQH